MTVRLCMGNEAIAHGAINSGVKIVAGYPGTPSTEIIETILREKTPNINVQWSVNEKAAMEIAAGASYTGARALVTMKQVGLNVASDPLMSLAYIGVKGGLVIVAADDPGPWSSQTEQDTRGFAKNANLPVYDPASPEEAYEMIQEAFDLSEEFALPVFVRPTTRVCHASASVDIAEAPKEQRTVSGFEKRPEWCIFPALSYRKHGEIEIKQRQLSDRFSASRFNTIEGSSRKGIAVSGVSYLYAKEVIEEYKLDVTIFKVGNPYPLPEKKAEEFLSKVDSVLVIEELDPIVEEGLLLINQGGAEIYGKRTGHTPCNGEFSYEVVKQAIFKYLGLEEEAAENFEMPQFPMRPPVLCPGCPHRASFYAAKVAMKDEKKVVYCGDIGCYTLGNAAPLNTTDTCLCMGAGITIAQGLQLAEEGIKTVSFIGDSTFFASGITGIINAVYQKTKITLIVLDNHTTAMTGHQPHPGTGFTAMGEQTKALDPEEILRACGVEYVKKVNPFDFEATVEAIRGAKDFDGPAAVITRAPCIFKAPKPAVVCRVNDACIGCLKCIREIGCPAMTPDKDGKVVINEALCTGCGLCAKLCPTGAIKEVSHDA